MADRIEVENYTQVLRDLRRLDPDVSKELRQELRAIVPDVASDAKANASWSKRIPRAIAVSVTNRAVAIRVRRSGAPHGSLFERGSKGGGGQIRHPLFGDRNHWYTTPTRPFIQPAMDDKRDDILRRSDKALRDAVRKAGWLTRG